MKRAGTFILIVILVTGVAPNQSTAQTPWSSAPPQATTISESEPEWLIHADTPEEADLARWAIGRFRQAGLILPELDLYFRSRNEGCQGNLGLHTKLISTHSIEICTPTKTRQPAVVLHELGHAWTTENLTIEKQEGFLAMRNLESWRTGSDWAEMGNEHAAEIIAWGLNVECRPPGRIGNHDQASLTAAFEYLTGTAPLCKTGSALSSFATPVDPAQGSGRQA